MAENTQRALAVPNVMEKVKQMAGTGWFRYALTAALLAVAAAVLVPQWLHPRPTLTTPMPISSAIETQWGIRITQVAVTADGGMVDLRYAVIDPNKAQIVGVDPQDTPVLIAEDKSLVAVTAQMPHKEVLLPGTTYFLLYQNAHGAIKSQTYVTLLMGDIKVENVPVR